jgi:hypothetical protein
MRTWQLILRGYNPETSATDHLIKWVKAAGKASALLLALHENWDVVEVNEITSKDDSEFDAVVEED